MLPLTPHYRNISIGKLPDSLIAVNSIILGPKLILLMAKKFVQAANVPRPLFIAKLPVLPNGLIHIVNKMGTTGSNHNLTHITIISLCKCHPEIQRHEIYFITEIYMLFSGLLFLFMPRLPLVKKNYNITTLQWTHFNHSSTSSGYNILLIITAYVLRLKRPQKKTIHPFRITPKSRYSQLKFI